MNAPAKPPIDIGKRTEQYIKLRDKIAEIKKRHEEELKPFADALQQLNALLLQHLNTVGSDSAKTNGVGTVYRTEKVSATITDKEAFTRHVIGTESWDLVDWKANKTATVDFINEQGTTPPGVNVTTTYVVGVRRD